jgi:hypothetical protein
MRVTLLGFKEIGRGTNFKQRSKYDFFDEVGWIKVVQELNKKIACPYISIDTALARSSQDKLVELECPDYLYHVEEGKYSMYIDAVNSTYGPSSYHLDKMLPLKDSYDIDIKGMFASVQIV